MKRLRGLGQGARSRRGYGQSAESMEEGGGDAVFTPLIDIFTSIVFFLMVGFTAAGQWTSLTPGVELPQSAGEISEDRLRVGVSTDRITLDDAPLISVEDAMASGTPDEPYLIPALYERLRAARTEIEDGSARAAGSGLTARLAIQGDRRIPYAVMSRVVYSARRAGFESFDLHVEKMDGTSVPGESL